MILRKILVFMLIFALSSCGEAAVEPHWVYKSEFDPSMIEGIEDTMAEIAKKWGLRLYEKDREGMEFLTQGKAAFAIAFYYKNDAVLIINNVGVGDILSLMVIDYGKMPIDDLKRLTDEVIDTLKTRFDIEFKQEESTAPVNTD